MSIAEEFDAIEEADWDYRHELINGRWIVSPRRLEAERGPIEELGYRLLSYRDAHLQGSALDDALPVQIVVTHSQRRRPDRVIWKGLVRQPDPRTDSPSIVAEWVSESKRDWLGDFQEKRQEYRELGIGEYWFFGFRRTMTVYRGRADTPLLPGFELPLAHLLAVADRWQ